MYALSLVLLLFLSSFVIKSNLTSQHLTIPVTSRPRSRSFRLQSIRSARYSEVNETGQSDGEIHVEADDDLSHSQEEADVERAQQRAEKLKLQITEIFKASRKAEISLTYSISDVQITINFLQVVAVAIAVNVHWTRHMISLFSAAGVTSDTIQACSLF